MGFCAVVGCKSNSVKDRGVRFFQIPSIQNRQKVVEASRIERRARWISALRRKFTESQLKHSRVCSKHFITGRPSENPDHPDCVPSLNLGYRTHHIDPKIRLERYERMHRRRKLELIRDIEEEYKLRLGAQKQQQLEENQIEDDEDSSLTIVPDLYNYLRIFHNYAAVNPFENIEIVICRSNSR